MAQAYFFAGDTEQGIAAALRYVEGTLMLSLAGNPDIIIERHGLFAVDDARRIAAKAELMPAAGTQKVFIIAASRIFHEAQNAMLKLFEEPPAGTTLILIVPSEGDLIYTLRSRLSPLPALNGESLVSEEAKAFAEGNAAAREKIVEKILEDAKSDSDEEKQQARAAALRLAEGLARAGYAVWRDSESDDMRMFLNDLDTLIPILHDRSAPLKPILEHILIIAPKKLA